jgi:hypothetical protein
MALPTLTETPLQTQLRADHRAIAAGEHGADSEYRAQGLGSAVPMRVRIDILPVQRMQPIAGSLPTGVGSVATTAHRRLALMVEGIVAGEAANAAGVGVTSGGVKDLRVGDVFRVHGASAGRPGGEIDLRVTGDIQLMEGVIWSCEVRP